MTDHLTDEAVKAMLDGTTPGPWTVETGNVPIADTGDYDGYCRLMAGGRIIFEQWGDDEQSEKDAHLAGAAPDLARALIAYAREAVPALSAERAALKTDVTTYQAMVMDLTAEGEALRAKLAEVTAERSSLSAMFATQAEETQAAKARVAELEALIRGKTFTVDESVELKAENERLRTPQGAAKVLLTISDVEIKPAAKALQDAFNLKGIGWKRYLSALRAAITALQETKP